MAQSRVSLFYSDASMMFPRAFLSDSSGLTDLVLSLRLSLYPLSPPLHFTLFSILLFTRSEAL